MKLLKTNPSIDLSFYIKGVGDDPNLLKESLSKVERSWTHHIKEMEKALKSNDPKTLHYWAHMLKGNLAFIKAEDGVSLAKEICEGAKKSEVERTKLPFRSLKEYMTKLRDKIEKFKERI